MKGNKLPKVLWKKGKSKFFYPRLIQENISFGTNVWDGIMKESPLDLLYKKVLAKSIK